MPYLRWVCRLSRPSKRATPLHVLLLSFFLVFISLRFLVWLLFHIHADEADIFSLPFALSVAKTTSSSPHCLRAFTQHTSDWGRVPALTQALAAVNREWAHHPGERSTGPVLGAVALPKARGQPLLWGRSSPGWQPTLLPEPWRSEIAVSHVWQDLCSAWSPLLWAKRSGSVDSQTEAPYSLWPGLRFQSFLALLQDPSLESLPSFRGQSHPVTRPPGTRPGASSSVSPQPSSLLLPISVPVPHSDSSLLLSHHPDAGHVGVHLDSRPTVASTCVLPLSSFFPRPVGLIFSEAISFLSLEACETFSWPLEF